jgi:hypothetical protein
MKKLTVLKMFGFLLFLCSATLPFMSRTWSYEGLLHHALYWSFAAQVSDSAFSTPSQWFSQNTYYFQNYWSLMSYQGPSIPFIFAAQILTLSASLASFFVTKKRMISLVSVLFCSLVIASMIYLGTIFPMQNYYPYYPLPTYELGFWLAFPSLCVFLATVILEHRQKTNPNIFALP